MKKKKRNNGKSFYFIFLKESCSCWKHSFPHFPSHPAFPSSTSSYFFLNFSEYFSRNIYSSGTLLPNWFIWFFNFHNIFTSTRRIWEVKAKTCFWCFFSFSSFVWEKSWNSEQSRNWEKNPSTKLINHVNDSLEKNEIQWDTLRKFIVFLLWFLKKIKNY